jgi:hypothetical protein
VVDMSWRAFLICVGCGGALACGSTSNVAGDDGGGSDGSQSSDATVPSDAESGAWQDTGAGGYDTGSADGNGSNDGGATDSSGSEGGSSTDSGESDATDASDGGGIIIFVPDSGDDGPGTVEGGATVYFPCGPTLTCKTQTQFCLHTVVRVDAGVSETWDCVGIPAACEPSPTCSCLMNQTSVTFGCPCTPQVGLEIDCHP